MGRINFEDLMANRISKLPPYVFTVINKLKNEARMRGLDIIDMGMGSPDMPVPDPINKALVKALNDRHINRYPVHEGTIELKRAIAYWYGKRFGVDLNPADEVLVLIGAKEGLANLSSAFLNKDDFALVPTPTYPIFYNSAIISGANLFHMPCLPENDWLPDYQNLPDAVLHRAKLMFLSYPHNPTTKTVDKAYFDEVVHFCKDHRIIVSHDAAYSELCYDGYKAPGFLEAEGAKDIGVEFHSFSKTFNMAGWRIAFVVGNPQILKILGKMKSYVDFGCFTAIQHAAVTALEMYDELVPPIMDIYARRRTLICDGLDRLGWHHQRPNSTMYVWVPIPEAFKDMDSMEFASLIVKETGIAVAPGIGFGEIGNSYIRFALVEPEERIEEALDRLSKL